MKRLQRIASVTKVISSPYLYWVDEPGTDDAEMRSPKEFPDLDNDAERYVQQVFNQAKDSIIRSLVNLGVNGIEDMEINLGSGVTRLTITFESEPSQDDMNTIMKEIEAQYRDGFGEELNYDVFGYAKDEDTGEDLGASIALWNDIKFSMHM
jgi:hypothetical protein